MKKFLVLILAALFLPFVVKASDPEFKLTCPLEWTIGSELSCQVEINSEVKIKEISAKYQFGDSFQYVEIVPLSNFGATSYDENGFTIEDPNGASGNVGAMYLGVKFLKAGTLTLTDIKIVDINDKTYSANSISRSIGILSATNTLKGVTLSAGKINFNPSIAEYFIDIASDVTSVAIDAELADKNSKFVKGYEPREVTITGEETDAQIKVVSASGNIRTYTFKFLKSKLSSNTNIKELYIDNTLIKLQENVQVYEVKVVESSELEFEVVLEDENAGYVIINNELKNGDNIIVRVIAENGSKCDYVFKIVKVKSQEVAHITDSGCGTNIYLYYLLMFFLGVLFTLAIWLLVNARKNRKQKQPVQNNTAAPVQNSSAAQVPNGYNNQNTEVLDFGNQNK